MKTRMVITGLVFVIASIAFARQYFEDYEVPAGQIITEYVWLVPEHDFRIEWGGSSNDYAKSKLIRVSDNLEIFSVSHCGGNAEIVVSPPNAQYRWVTNHEA